jgi:peroxiredoxin
MRHPPFVHAIVGFVMLLALCAPSVRAAEEDNSTLTKVGDAVPKFSVQTTDGQTLTPDSLKGKVVLLNFFATWCGPCNEEMPALQKVHEKYKDKAFTLVSVGREHSIDEVKKFAEQKKLTFAFAAAPKREAYKLFATQFIPRSYVIDRDGKIVYQTMGFGGPMGMKDIEEAIDKALAANASASAKQ